MLRQKILPRSFTGNDALERLGAEGDRELQPVIRCLVWNILKARRRDWMADFSELVHDRDLVLLQEAVVNAPSDRLFHDSRRHEWLMARSHEHPVSGVVTGVKTGCVAESISSVVHVSPHTEPLLRTQKLMLETHYTMAGDERTLMVLNMHAINFVSVKKYASHLDQLTSLIGAHDGPVILAGDFNTWSTQRLAHFHAVTRQAGLHEANMDRRGRLAHFNQHLDHVFYRGLRLRSVESLSHYQSSDHYPITATFQRIDSHGI